MNIRVFYLHVFAADINALTANRRSSNIAVILDCQLIPVINRFICRVEIQGSIINCSFTVSIIFVNHTISQNKLQDFENSFINNGQNPCRRT